MSGPLRLVPGDGDALPFLSAPRPRPRGRTRPSWAADPIDDLAERLVEPIASAVHPYEVAALLESDGLTGEQIRERYDRPDLFALAEDLYARVPRHYPRPLAVPDPWRADPVRCALRGLVFAMPGLAYVLGAGLWQGAAGVAGLVASGLAAWAWNQALGHRAHVRLGTDGTSAAARTLALGAPSGALVASLVGLAVTGPGAGAVFAAGQCCYLAAATVLLVLGRERVLLAALLPVAAGAATVPVVRPPVPLAVALLLATVVAAAVAAWHTVRGAFRSSPPAGGDRSGLLRSLPYGVFGLAAGVLAALTGADDAGLVVLLTLSMGFAEWLLYRYRSLALTALRGSVGIRHFALRATRALALCLGAYMACLAIVAPALGAGLAAVLSLLALGAVLWTALLLQAFSAAWVPALVTLLAAAAEAGAAGAGLPADPVRLVCRSAAAVVLVVTAVRQLGRPTAHR
ncbi:hypothetical protein ABZ070_31040 [Streptomyces sp. NPDC006283]|uniref:hypothetical protein n=1 Tax=Streptomyces sp. NPDC006283 TaxID=3156741 RepID=UPI0033BF52E4